MIASAQQDRELSEIVAAERPRLLNFVRRRVAKPADVDATLRMATKDPPPEEPAVEPTPDDEQPTMRLGNDDDTLPLDRD